MPILEKTLERRCMAYAKEQGWLFVKIGQQGWPDRLLVMPGGHHIWMELKTGSRLSKIQHFRIATLLKIGARAHVINTFEDFTALAHAVGGQRVPFVY